MKLFLDTNIILEAMLGHERAGEVYSLLNEFERYDFFISDFSIYSIAAILFKLNKYEAYLQFVDDMILSEYVKVLRMAFDEMPLVVGHADRFSLDFDDAYQYSLAVKHNLNIVSFDGDFDRTERGRKAPSDFIN